MAAAAGSQGEREQLFKRLSAEKDGGTDVIITSYDLLKRDLAFYRSMDFRYQIIDEASTSKMRRPRHPGRKIRQRQDQVCPDGNSHGKPSGRAVEHL